MIYDTDVLGLIQSGTAWQDRFKWLRQHKWLGERLKVAHKDLVGIAAILRDTVNEVWTEVPSDPDKLAPGVGGSAYSLEGWRSHFGHELKDIKAIDTEHGDQIQIDYPEVKTVMDGYRASIPAIGTVLASISAGYEDANGDLVQVKLTQADRDAIATAIEAELQ